MKLMKVIALVSFASIVVVGTALAAKQGIKPKESESASSAPQATQTAQKNTNDTPLSLFQKHVNIHFEERKFIVNEDNQAYVLAKYSIENLGNKPIKSLYWIASYWHEQQMLYSQDIPLDFAKPLAAKSKATVNLRIPFNKIQDEYRTLFTNSQDVSVYSVPRSVTFVDGQQINVSN